MVVPHIPLLDVNYKDLSYGDFILKLEQLANTLEPHPAFKDAPPWVSGPIQFRQHAEAMRVAGSAAEQDEAKEAKQEAARANGQKAIHFSAQYLVMFADHHQAPDMLQNVGMDQKTKGGSRDIKKSLPFKPTKFAVTAGKNGVVHVLVNHGFEKGGVEVQICEGDPTREGSWRTHDHYYSCRFEIMGLESVKKYYLRVRFKNAAGAGPWSDVETVVVN